jgi:peptidyl-prolyl cis-trans isomerase SurA
MKKVILFTLSALLLSIYPLVSAEKSDPVLLNINGREITVSEFEYVYTKNNLNPHVMDPKSLNEYLELFINFNLKVQEALQLKLDTHSTFINELEGYRKQLAQPYLTDQDISKQLLDEAYERMQYDVRASHILFRLEKYASPQDTLVAWNRAMEVRNRIIGGADFGQMAREYSDDPSAKGMSPTANRAGMRGNSGDLGYFSVLDMVYPFESAVYNLEIGQISMPVRTDFGYHIMKLRDKHPAIGRASVAHIMIATPPDADETQLEQAKSKIDELHQKLKGGEDFAALAQRFSDDKASGRRGGEIPAFTSNRMVPEFIKAIADLDTRGQISEPVRTQYGWHIIKFIEKNLPSQEDAMAELKTRISRDSRAQLSQQIIIERLKKEYNFSENPDNLVPFYTLVDNKIFEGKWDLGVMSDLPEENLFSFANKNFTTTDFALYLDQKQTMRSPESIRSFIGAMYDNFLNESLLAYEEENLTAKFPEFRKIMREYHDGILLFELTDQKVWSKAMADTTGLNTFFFQNIENYIWGDRFNAIIYAFNTEEAAKEGRKIIRKAHRKNTPHEEIMLTLNKNSLLEVSADNGLFEVSEKPVLSEIRRKKGATRVMNYNGHPIVIWVNEFLPSQPKKLNEIRGQVIADYQNYLEEQWVNELRERYTIVINQEALDYLINRN